MIYCCFVGPIKDHRIRELTEDFHRRLERLWPVTLLEIPEKTKALSDWLEGKKAKGDWVSLEAHGAAMDSATFIQWVTRSSRDLHFVIWGADGPPSGLTLDHFKRLSLSPMTFNHEIARLLLMEQLYRAGATLKGHPYPR